MSSNQVQRLHKSRWLQMLMIILLCLVWIGIFYNWSNIALWSYKPVPVILTYLNVTANTTTQTVNSSNVSVNYRYKTIDRQIRIHYFNPNQWTGPDTFKECAFNCFITFGGTYKHYSTSKFVIFDASHTLPRKPPPKPPGQTWIYHGMEPPFLQPRLQNWRRKFNWTISYRRDADFTHTYGTMLFKQVKDTERILLRNNWPGKTRGVAWFVTKRNVPSGRDQFVRSLRKFINVDIYSRNGLRKCPTRQIKDCFKLLRDQYKYYLSFENSICRDYVTEKCFKIYAHLADVIPVVRGVEDYSLFVPPSSYIDTAKFSNISSLAQLQMELVNNRTAFENYFQWRKYYYAKPTGSRTFCKLCAEVHRVPVKQRLYDDLDTWIQGDKNNHMCQKASDIK